MLHLRATRDAAAAIGTEHSAKVVAMLDDLEPFVDLDAEPCGSGGRYFKLTEERREVWSQGGNVVSDGEWLCRHFDGFFYRFDKAWEDEVIAWLKAGAPSLEFRDDY